jgi:hypothetical protein
MHWRNHRIHSGRCMCDAGCMAQIVCPLVSAEDRARLEAIVADRNRAFKRGVFRSMVELQTAINRCLAEHKRDPQPFAWTKRADKILAKVNRLNASVL